MQITIKLYATLGQYLPAGTDGNVAPYEVSEDTSVQAVLDQLNLPPELTHLVLKNGVYVAPEDRPGTTVAAGDAVAVWPPVAGG